MAVEGIQVRSGDTGIARSWPLPAALLAVSLIGSASLGMPAAAPGRPVAVLFPPWWGSAVSLGAAAAAGGSVLELGRLPGLVVARSDNPDFSARLRAAGALVLIDPRGLGLCSPVQRRPSLERPPQETRP